jgi:hypothetical protein
MMTISVTAKFCTSCGEPIEPGNSFCTGCGTPVTTVPIAAGSMNEADESLPQADAIRTAEEDMGTSELMFENGHINGDEPTSDVGATVSSDSEPATDTSAESSAIANDASETDRRADTVAASFQFLVVREIDPSLEPEVEGLIYPLPAIDAGNSVVLEARDGTDVKRIVASGFKVVDLTGGKAQRLSASSDLRIDVIITDARVALACSKFAKGGGWTPLGVGALPVTLVLNGVSKARAASRRRGKMLVGQVRYPWLAAVGGSTKSGYGTSEQLRLCVGTQNRRLLALDVTLPKNIDSTAVAAEIARRAARFRIDSTDSNVAEHADEFEELTTATPLPSPKGQFGLRAIPGHWPVDAKSARVGLVKP